MIRNGSEVESATVIVNDEMVGTTDASGEFTFEVPEDDSLAVVVEIGAGEVEFEREFGTHEGG